MCFFSARSSYHLSTSRPTTGVPVQPVRANMHLINEFNHKHALCTINALNTGTDRHRLGTALHRRGSPRTCAAPTCTLGDRKHCPTARIVPHRAARGAPRAHRPTLTPLVMRKEGPGPPEAPRTPYEQVTDPAGVPRAKPVILAGGTSHRATPPN